MKDRIKEARKLRGKTQEQFAAPLNLSGNYIHLLEKGERQPSDRTIADIARIWDISEEWLKTGIGEIEEYKDADKKISDFMGDILNNGPSFKKRLVHTIARMTEEEWAILERKIEEISTEKEQADL